MGSPVASVEIRAESARLAADLAKASAKFERFAAGVKGQASKAGGGKGFFGSVYLGNLASSATNKAVSGFEDMARSAYKFEDQLTRLQIAADSTPQKIDAFRETVRKTSRETGLDANSIEDAAAAYVKLTGDLDTAAAATNTFARVAQAADANISDIALTGAQLGQTMDVTADQMEAAFSALIVQGKAGAIELKDMSTELAGVAPQFAQFAGGKGLSGLKQLGASMQVVRHGFVDASETATGMRDLMTAIVKHADRLHKGGVNVFERDPKSGAKHLRNFYEIVQDIGKSRLMKNPQALVKAFGTQEAYRAFLQLQQNGQLYEDLITKAGDVGAVQRDLNTYLSSGAGKVTLQWERVKNAVAEAFTPERIQKFASAIESLIDGVSTLISGIDTIGSKLGGIGKQLGKELGWQTEEDKQKDRDQDYYFRRVAKLAGLGDYDQMGHSFTSLHGYQSKFSDLKEQLAAKGLSIEDFNQNIGEEDLLMKQLLGGKRAGMEVKKPGGAMPRSIDEGYSLPELVALSKKIPGSGYSNAENILKYGIPRAIEIETKRQNARALVPIIQLQIKIGEDTIAKANAAAPKHRSRPHG